MAITINPTPRQLAAADLLDASATLLETKGWCRNSYENRKGAHCAVGAIAEASRGVESETISYVYVALSNDIPLDCIWPGGSSAIIRWNDKQTDRRKVVRRFRNTAERLRKPLVI